MADYNFVEDEELGVTVDQFKPFCMLNKNIPIPDDDFITGDKNIDVHHGGLIGHKFSKLCGFKFKSALPNPQYPYFQFVYCPKMPAHIGRRYANGMSGWYIWQSISSTEKQILGRSDFYKYYLFNPDKFARSNVVAKFVPMFIKECNEAMETVCKEYVDKVRAEDPMRAVHIQHYLTRIQQAIPQMADILNYNPDSPLISSDDKNIIEPAMKVAYNADHSYSLVKNAKFDKVKATDPK